jgi:hypothetical protein
MGTGAVFSGPYQPQPFAPSPFQQYMGGGQQPTTQDPGQQMASGPGRIIRPGDPGYDPGYAQRIASFQSEPRGRVVDRSQPHVVPRPLVQVPAQLPMNGFGQISSPFAPNSFFSAQPSPVRGYNSFNDLNTAANRGLGGMMFGGMGGFAPRPQPFGMGFSPFGFSPFGFSQPSFGFGQPSMGGFPGKGGGGAFAPPPPTPSVGFSGKGGGGAYPSQPSPFGSALGHGLGGMQFFR